MRARLLPLSMAVVILLLAPVAAGCSGQEAASSGETSAPAAGESSPGADPAAYVTVDVQAAYEALSSDQAAQLLDVREPEEWAETGVPQGAVLIPLAEVESRATAELAKDDPVYVICRSGNRSQVASEALVGLGYTQVYNVAGGVTAWVQAGLPVETYAP